MEYTRELVQLQKIQVYRTMIMAQKSGKNARGETCKSFKSRKQVSTKFKPPTHPAIVVTSAFTAPHIESLKKKLEEYYIPYGMQTSKKKVNRPPGTPPDKNFIIVDDSQGTPVLQGQFTSLKMCRVDYPNKNNLNDVIKKFDSYIGLGKQEVEQQEFCEAEGYANWEQQEQNIKQMKLLNNKNQFKTQINGQALNRNLQNQKAENVLAVAASNMASNYKSVFQSKNKDQFAQEEGGSKKDKKKKDRKKGKASAKSSNINLKSIKQYGQAQEVVSTSQKRVLFVLLTENQSSRYSQYTSQFYQSKNRRIIVIRSIQEYYHYSYESCEGENCLLLSPNAAFKYLYKFRNLKSVYLYGEDEKLCAQLVKGNIKRAALTPSELDKLLIQEGFNKNQALGLVEPKRKLAAKAVSPAYQNIKPIQQQKLSLFDKFLGLIKGKSKSKDKAQLKQIGQHQPKQKKQQKGNEKAKEKGNERREGIGSFQKEEKNASKQSSGDSQRSLSEDKEKAKNQRGKENKLQLAIPLQQKQIISLCKIVDSKPAEGPQMLNFKNQQNNKKKESQKMSIKKLKSQQKLKLSNQNVQAEKAEIDMQYYKNSNIPPLTKVQAKKNQRLGLEKLSALKVQKKEEDKFLLKSALKKQQQKLIGNAQTNRGYGEVKFNFENTPGQKSVSSSSALTSSQDDEAFIQKKLPDNKKIKLNKKNNQAIDLQVKDQAIIQANYQGIIQKTEEKKPKEEDDIYLLNKNYDRKENDLNKEEKDELEQEDAYFSGENKQIDKKNMKKRSSSQQQNQYFSGKKECTKLSGKTLNVSLQKVQQSANFYQQKNNKAFINIHKKNVFKKDYPDLQPVFFEGKSDIYNDKNQYINTQVTPKIQRAPFTQTNPHSQSRKQSKINSRINLQEKGAILENGYYVPNLSARNSPQSQLINPRLLGKGNFFKPAFQRNNRSLTATEPRNFNLPFDESKYDRFIQGGVTVYKPKLPFSHTLPNQPAFPNNPQPSSYLTNFSNAQPPNNPLNFNTFPPPPQPPPPIFTSNGNHFARPPFNSPNMRSFSLQNPKDSNNQYQKFTGVPAQNRLGQPSKSPQYKTVAKNSNSSAYQYFMNKQKIEASPNRWQNPNFNSIGNLPKTAANFNTQAIQSEQLPYYQKIRPKPQQRQPPPANKQNISLHQAGSNVKNAPTLRKRLAMQNQLLDSFDSNSSDFRDEPNRLSLRSKSLNRNVDPLSQILDNFCIRPADPSKNYSILYLVHSKSNPKIIKQLFEISDEYDTLQTYSHPDKMNEIIKKGESVFDYILVFPNSGEPNLQEVKNIKGLRFIEYDPQAHQSDRKNKRIFLKNIADLPKILARQRPEVSQDFRNLRTKKIGYIYFKDFNRPIRDLTKMLKLRYPHAQIRRYFGLMDLPTKLPREKNSLTIVMLDQVGLNQILAYCTNQQKQNANIMKICIPKSSDTLKLCQKSSTAQNMIWLTEKQAKDADFIIKRIQKRFQ